MQNQQHIGGRLCQPDRGAGTSSGPGLSEFWEIVATAATCRLPDSEWLMDRLVFEGDR